VISDCWSTDALRCENKRWSDSSPWPIEPIASVLTTTPIAQQLEVAVACGTCVSPLCEHDNLKSLDIDCLRDPVVSLDNGRTVNHPTFKDGDVPSILTTERRSDGILTFVATVFTFGVSRDFVSSKDSQRKRRLALEKSQAALRNRKTTISCLASASYTYMFTITCLMGVALSSDLFYVHLIVNYVSHRFAG